jgi:DNA-binding NarL/FixJ family response regulator
MPLGSANPSRFGLELLTGQERRVLRLLKDGHLNKQIAHELAVTERTVKSHVSAILRKLQVATRTQAAIAARELEDHGQFS